MLRWTAVLWLLVFGALTGAAVADSIFNLDWRYEARDVWGGMLMIVFGCGFWLAATFINHVVLALSRRLYGSEPSGPVEG